MEISDCEPIKGCKHPLIASGATPIGSAGRAPDEESKEENEIQTCLCRKMTNKARLLSLYSKKFDYSLRATPIGSAGRAPDEDGNYRLRLEEGNYRLCIINFIVKRST
jgi:hypothetical protein